MGKTLLSINNLHASLENGQEILSGLNLTVNPGETHVIMGPNGAGKSTLAHVIMGNPNYQVTSGEILFEGENITEEPTDARARQGIFLAFQTPEEVDGISLENFLHTARTAVTGETAKLLAFRKQLTHNLDRLEIEHSYAERYLNVGFSGGEKKKSEVLQMLTLDPKLAILDETDSGLDVDAIKTVAAGIHSFQTSDKALIIISHNAALLENLTVDYVHILAHGRLSLSGDRQLITQVLQEGFQNLVSVQ